MSTNTSPYADFDPYYRDSRLHREWTKALTDYRIEWEDRTSPKGPCPKLHLNHQELDLYIVNRYQFDWRITYRSLFDLPANGKALVGDDDGRFSLIYQHELMPSQLLWCPDCEKAFFQASSLYGCPVCMSDDTWLVEDKKLLWYGYPGEVNFHPKNLDDDLFRKQAHENLTAAFVADASDPKAEASRIASLNQMAFATIEKFRVERDDSGNDPKSESPTSPAPEPFWKKPKEPPVNDLFSDSAANSASAREDGSWENLKSALSGPARVHGWPRIEAIEELARMYPNFSEVCRRVLAEVKLGPYRKQAQMRIPNLLILGSPSCGKSSFCRRLAQIVAPGDWQSFDLAHNPPDFELVGTDSGFSKSKEGRVLRLLASNAGSPVRNPVLILDELDKIDTQIRHSVMPALLGLLDKESAKQFRDGFFGVPVDASGIQILTTANDQYLVKGPLASRVEFFTVADYTPEQMADVVVPNIYREWTSQFHEGTFPSQLSRSTCQMIGEEAGFVPRRVASVLVGLADQRWGEFRPAPTFESLAASKEEPCQPEW